tara:strand:- start:46 stop:882 length:837 start_codon:yes stop_codon:yes gene_type:complete
MLINGPEGFLFMLAFVVTVIAVIQDMKTTEVSNWLNFSFVGIALGYRAFYSSIGGNWNFFMYGLLGFALMFVLGQIFYYTKTFGGGDVKLLQGFGVILPYYSYKSVLVLGLGFVLLLFLSGLIWSLIYSVYLVGKNRKRFRKEFKENWKKYRMLVGIGVIVFLLSLIFRIGMLGLFVLLLSLLWIYVKSLDGVMIVWKKAGELREGDWLEKEVKVGNKKIAKSVHGLSLEEMKMLKRYGKGKEVLIKEGIPFTPGFLIALGIMVFFLKVLLAFLSLFF